jgi:hypothetical protein
MGPFDLCTTSSEDERGVDRESVFATAATCFAGFTQLVSNAPADAASIVRPKLRRLNTICSSFTGLMELQESQPLEVQVLQPFSELLFKSVKLFIVSWSFEY